MPTVSAVAGHGIGQQWQSRHPSGCCWCRSRIEVLDESLDESPLLDAVSVLSVVPQAATAISMAALRGGGRSGLYSLA